MTWYWWLLMISWFPVGFLLFLTISIIPSLGEYVLMKSGETRFRRWFPVTCIIAGPLTLFIIVVMKQSLGLQHKKNFRRFLKEAKNQGFDVEEKNMITIIKK